VKYTSADVRAIRSALDAWWLERRPYARTVAFMMWEDRPTTDERFAVWVRDQVVKYGAAIAAAWVGFDRDRNLRWAATARATAAHYEAMAIEWKRDTSFTVSRQNEVVVESEARAAACESLLSKIRALGLPAELSGYSDPYSDPKPQTKRARRVG
jgi:hypothetical protein